MVDRSRGLAGLRLGNRDAALGAKVDQFAFRIGIENAAAVTMLVAPGPIEDVQAIMRLRRVALAKAIAAWAIACSLWAR